MKRGQPEKWVAKREICGLDGKGYSRKDTGFPFVKYVML